MRHCNLFCLVAAAMMFAVGCNSGSPTPSESGSAVAPQKKVIFIIDPHAIDMADEMKLFVMNEVKNRNDLYNVIKLEMGGGARLCFKDWTSDGDRVFDSIRSFSVSGMIPCNQAVELARKTGADKIIYVGGEFYEGFKEDVVAPLKKFSTETGGEVYVAMFVGGIADIDDAGLSWQINSVAPTCHPAKK